MLLVALLVALCIAAAVYMMCCSSDEKKKSKKGKKKSKKESRTRSMDAQEVEAPLVSAQAALPLQDDVFGAADRNRDGAISQPELQPAQGSMSQVAPQMQYSAAPMQYAAAPIATVTGPVTTVYPQVANQVLVQPQFQLQPHFYSQQARQVQLR